MNKKWKKSAQRFFALFLCVAMLLPMFPQVVLAGSGNVTTGVVLEDGVVAGGGFVATGDTNLSGIKLTRLGNQLFQSDRIAVMSNAYGYIMSYDPIGTSAGANVAESLKEDENGHSENTYYFADDDENIVIIDHSDRDNALWIIKQYSNVRDDGVPKDGAGLNAYNKGNSKQYAYFGYDYPYTGTGAEGGWDRTGRNYPGIELQKGVTNGDNATIINPFWSCTSSTSYAYRWLNVKQDANTTTPFQIGGIGDSDVYKNDTRGRYRCEYIKETDGTYSYLLYFYYDGNKEFSVLYCDAYGEWGVKKYTGTSFADVQAQVNANLDIHKLRFYKYETDPNADAKDVQASGYSKYVVVNKTRADVLRVIQQYTTVVDVNRQSQYIPCNGTTAKVGYYHIVAPSGTAAAGNYYLKYTTDSGDTVDIGQVEVSNASLTTSTASMGTGITSLNSSFKAAVYSAALGSDGTTYEATNEAITFNVGGLTVPVTLNMLRSDQNAFFDSSKSYQTGAGTVWNVKFGGTQIGKLTMYVAGKTLAQQTPAYPLPGSVYSNKQTTTEQVDFSKSGEATIELSAAGVSSTNAVDLIIMLDLSSSMRYKLNVAEGEALYYFEPYYTNDFTVNSNWNTNNHPTEKINGQLTADNEWNLTRMYAMEEALKKMIKSLQASGTDVNVAMADFGDLDYFEFDNSVLYTTGSGGYSWRWHFINTGNSNGSYYTLENGKEMSNHLNFILGRDDYNFGEKYEDEHPNSGDKTWCSQPFDLHEWKYWSKEYATGKYENGNSVGGTAGVNYATDTINGLMWGKQKPVVYTSGQSYNKNAVNLFDGKNSVTVGGDPANAFTDVDDLDANAMETIIKQLRISNSRMLGTNYDVGLEYAYKIAYERRLQNMAAGEDREIICVFMSDGAAMQYNYFSGRTVSEAWSQYIIGETDEILTNHVDSGLQKNTPYSWDLTMDASGNLSKYSAMHPDVQWLLTQFHHHLALGSLYPIGNVAYGSCDCGYSTSLDGKHFFSCLNEKGVEISWNTFFNLHARNNNSTNNNALFTEMKKRGIDQRHYLIARLTSPAGSTSSYNSTTGTITGTGFAYQTYSPYYYFYNTEGKNWWAEAIKGDATKIFPVVNKYANGTVKDGKLTANIFNTTISSPSTYNGEVPNNYKPTLAEGAETPAWYGKNYIGGFKGLGMKLYTVGYTLCDENYVSKAEAEMVLQKIATYSQDPNMKYYYSAGSEAELNQALANIVNSFTVGATRTWVTDTMGKDYDLLLENDTEITVKKYPVSSVVNGAPVRDEENATVVEIIKITSVANKVAVSSLTGNTDIWDDTTGLISGTYVKYNTNTTTSVAIPFGTQGTYNLPAETFFWVIGTMPEEEIVLTYDVYLTGSMEGEYDVNAERDIHNTNEQAQITYVDNLNNSITKYFESPNFAYGDNKEIKVVIDYGIPVDIAVLDSDGYYTAKYDDADEETTVPSDAGQKFKATLTSVANIKTLNGEPTFASNKSGSDGNLKVSGNNVTYTPTVGNMSMDTYEKFSVKIQRTGDSSRYYYCTVYVIPATTMYYEQDFVTFMESHPDSNGPLGNDYTGKWSEPAEGGWSGNSTSASYRQDDDRVGSSSANVYGDDSGANNTYDSSATHSLDNSKFITVTSSKTGVAKFDFKGTGFDVISLTDCNTGSIIVSVYKASEYKTSGRKATPVFEHFVDTYYGYKYEGDKWVVDTSASNNALYQIPVMKVKNLDYGEYVAEITVSYNEWLDHKNKDNQYNFYLDAIRVYNPANDGKNDTTNVIKQAYLDDGEAFPVYSEVRDLLITANDFNKNTDGTGSGIVFIDNTKDTTKKTTYKIDDYKNYGPNNEVYLAKDQAIGFTLKPNANLAEVHIAMKLANGSSVTAEIKTYEGTTLKSTKTVTITSATDLYEDISAMLKNGNSFVERTVVIRNANTDNTILSITNIKTTYTAELSKDSAANLGSNTFGLRRTAIMQALDAMNAPENDNQPDQEKPEQNQPEQENPGTEGNPVSGDVEMNAVAMVLMSACVMLLAVLIFANIRKKFVK